MSKNKKTTAEVIHDYGELLTKYYLLVMLAVLPIYFQNGFSDLANSKYLLYRAISISYILICGLICFSTEAISNRGIVFKQKHALPIYFALAQVLFGILTFAFAEDHRVAFWGSGSWHNGLFSQSLFALCAIAVYYYFSDSIAIRIALNIGVAIPSILLVLNRFDIYPIDMGNKYTAFISTLGQTNWATACLACLMGAELGLFFHENNKIHKAVIYIIIGLSFAGAWVIGSDTILVVMAFEMFVLFGICLRSRELFKEFAAILALLGVVTEIIYLLVFVLFHDAFVFVDEGDAVNSILRKQVGIYIILVAVIIYAILYATRKKEWNRKALEIAFNILTLIIVVSFVAVIVLMVIVTTAPEKAGAFANIRMLRFDDDWGTHRGLNWKCALTGFLRLPVFRKIIGLGQGSFVACMASNPDLQNKIDIMYDGYILRVAHNEYLNMLIENGILGCFSYIGFLGTSFVTLWKKADKHRFSIMGLLSLSGYLACSIFLFQHVYATSFMYIFIAMGLSEVLKENNSNAN